MSIKAVLFDRDGVLIDSEAFYQNKNKKFLKRYGVDLTDEQSNETIGMTSLGTAMAFYKLVSGVDFDTFRELFVAYYDADPNMPYPELLFDDVIDTLEFLRSKGIKTAICSSACLEGIEDMIRECHLENYFDVIISGTQLKESKPNPEIYLLAAQKLGVTPDECIVIEDSETGILAGKNANMHVIAVKDTRYGLNQEKADEFIDHLYDVVERFK